MTTLIEAARQALEKAVPSILSPGWVMIPDEDFTTLRTAIEQAEKQQPVGVVRVLPLGDGHKPMHWADWTDADNPPPEGTKLYTTPPAAPVQEECVVCGDKVRVIPRPWVGLTEEEVKHAPHHMVDGAYHYSFKQGAEWADRWLREKNGGQV